MDLATITGVISGILLILLAISFSGSISNFWSLSGLMIVVGGTIAATLINFPLSRVIGTFKVVKIAFQKNTLEPEKTISLLVSFAEKARREGLLALEVDAEALEDPYLKKGIQLIVDGTDPELVRNILETELTFMEERHKQSAKIFEAMGASAPAFGMLGTLIGLIVMLGNLDDPSSIGPGMAVALLTTFYGSIIANLILLPIAGKLKVRSDEEVLNKVLMLEGILSIQAGENPRIVAEKMKSFLEPALRQKIERKDDGDL